MFCTPLLLVGPTSALTAVAGIDPSPSQVTRSLGLLKPLHLLRETLSRIGCGGEERISFTLSMEPAFRLLSNELAHLTGSQEGCINISFDAGEISSTPEGGHTSQPPARSYKRKSSKQSSQTGCDSNPTESVEKEISVIVRVDIYGDERTNNFKFICRSALDVCLGWIELLFNHSDLTKSMPASDFLTPFFTMLRLDALQLINYVKYYCVFLHARSLRQKSLPKKPDIPGVTFRTTPFTGMLHRHIAARLNSGDSDHNQKLFWSFANSKRCVEQVPQTFVQKALEKHRVAMETAIPEISDAEIRKYRGRFAQILDRYQGCSSKLVKSEYSTSACFEAKSSDGGAKVYLQRIGLKLGLIEYDLLNMVWCPLTGVTSIYGFTNLRRFDLIEMFYRNSDSSKRPLSISEVSDLTRLIHQTDYPEPRRLLHACAQAVLEPVKVRTITKGEAIPYQASKELQKSLHTYMKGFFQFSLMGKTLDKETEVSELSARARAHYGPDVDLNWVSGDYSAATDGINIRLTKLFFEVLLAKVIASPNYLPGFADLCRAVIHEHEVQYPDNFGINSVTMTNGQLMGSPLSFPALCAINLVCCWNSVFDHVVDFEDLPVLVNGDDILFRTTDDSYNSWLAGLTSAGFVPSPGKNFYHRRYFTINTQLYSQPTIKNTDGPIRPISYYNVAYLFGKSKVSSGDPAIGYKPRPIQDLYKDCVSSAFRPEIAHFRFLCYNKDKLSKMVKHRSTGFSMNYFLPKIYGGLGMDPFLFKCSGNINATLDLTLTRVQHQLASRLYQKYQGYGHHRPIDISRIDYLMHDPIGDMRIVKNVSQDIPKSSLLLTSWPTSTPLPPGHFELPPEPKFPVNSQQNSLPLLIPHGERFDSIKKRMVPTDFRPVCTYSIDRLKVLGKVTQPVQLRELMVPVRFIWTPQFLISPTISTVAPEGFAYTDNTRDLSL